MQPAYQSIAESCGASSSGEDLHPGLVYTPAYYEEKQLYSDLLESSEQCRKHKASPCINPPVAINEHCTTNIDLPPILWHGYKTVPKILSLTNTGRTILINGQWVKGRPYIEGGPLNGTYIFSQIHFHSPSEHEIDGKRYPLEMHVVHYKTSYLTQERAMLERDGTVVLVYLFQVLDTAQTDFSSVTKLAPKIEKVNSRTETNDVSLEQIVKPFTSNYYVYWGSVKTGKNSYLLQWIVNGGIVYVTKQEADELLTIMNFAEINVRSIPRMKPENNTIYYVEEVEEEEKKEEEKKEEEEKEEKEEEHDCYACRSYQEWWLSHFSHTCPYNDNNDCVDQDYHSGSNMQYDIGKEGEDSHSQPVLSCKKNLFQTRKNYSGLRICCHKMRKPIRKSCEPQRGTVCCTKDKCKVCVDSKPKDMENCKTNEVVITKETTSCPSVTTDAQLPECKEEPVCEEDKEIVKVKVACSCPSVKNCSTSSKCDEHIQIQVKRKKKNDSCKDLSKGASSSQSNKKKETKKKKEKKEENCEDVPASRKSSSVKRERSSVKRTKKSDPDCDAKKSNSKASNNSKKPKEKESKACEDESETPVECFMSSVTEKSFNEILREYDTTWLDDSNLKMSTKTESSDLCDKSVDIVSLKKSSFDLDENTIKTLFEKKREPKPPEPPAEDCTIDFLLKPNPHKSNPSSSYMSPKSISEELKCVENKVFSKGVNVPDITVNTVTLSGVRIPTENPNELPKEFCVQVELLFHANNKDFSECITQEYNLALMYNQNILQEYRGTLCPNKLQIGNYEKLELVPKYPELDNISIRLQDCTVKMESSDQICMRAKFLMKELNFKNLDTIGEQEGEENTDKKFLVLSDAVTQYSVKEFGKPKDFDILERISLQAKVSELPKKPFPEERTSLNSPVNFSTPKSQLSQLSLERGSLKNEKFENKSEVAEKLGQDARVNEGEGSKKANGSEKENKKCFCSEEGYKISNSSEGNSKHSLCLGESSKKPISFEETEVDEEEEKETKKNYIGKEITKKAVKELKNIFSNRKKTVYFMYEKVEKDQNSGKKVFIGTFRSKDDVKRHSNDKESIHSIDNEEKKLLLLSAKDSADSYDFVRISSANERELKIHSPSQSKNMLNDKKEVVTLHKSRPKHLGKPKKDRLNVVVGKALNQLQKDSRNYKRLAELVGINQKENSKISVYELQKSSDKEICQNSSFGTEVTDNQIARDTSFTFVSDVLSDRNFGEQPYTTESVEDRKSLTKKGSQSAVIIIPVEVESLSKVEVILVEHSDNSKKTILKRGREIIPCLDY